MLKKRQNEVKRNIFLFDEVKNIAGQLISANQLISVYLNCGSCNILLDVAQKGGWGDSLLGNKGG